MTKPKQGVNFSADLWLNTDLDRDVTWTMFLYPEPHAPVVPGGIRLCVLQLKSTKQYDKKSNAIKNAVQTAAKMGIEITNEERSLTGVRCTPPKGGGSPKGRRRRSAR